MPLSIVWRGGWETHGEGGRREIHGTPGLGERAPVPGEGLGFGTEDSGSEVWGLGFGVWGSGFGA